MTYTVKQLADLAGVTPRTLHYYDQIGLLRPSLIGENGYRHYDDAAALRLQQILFYRELDLRLEVIHAILDSPDFEVEAALRQHRKALLRRAERLEHLLETIDKTIQYLKGNRGMTIDDLFQGFDDETQARYEKEAMTIYDPEIVKVTSRRWENYSAEEKARILAEGGEVYRELAALIDREPADAAVQAVIGRWHQNVRAFYEPTPAIMRGLAQGYEENPEFAAFFTALHPDLPGFLRRAIEVYATSLE